MTDRVHHPAGVDAVFSALSDPTRRDVLKCLSERGPTSASTLASSMPVTRQAVAKHLSALLDAGLVSTERHGREVRYRLTPRPLTEAVSWMAGVGAEWDDRLEALRLHVGGRPRR